MPDRTYLAIDLKSFYASVECAARGLDPLKTNLVVADEERTEKTICLAVSPPLKAYGIGGRARLFEVNERVRQVNAERRQRAPGRTLTGSSCDADALAAQPELALDFIIARPRMALYMQVSTQIYRIYLKYIAPEDIHVYSIDEVFIDVTPYRSLYGRDTQALARTMILDVLRTTGITATAGIGTNLYLAKIAMDIGAKHAPPDENGVRIAALDERSYRQTLWSHRPLTDFWRVGRGYARKLEAKGLYTMGDIARCSLGGPDEFYNEDLLYRMFGVQAELLIDHAWGWEPCTIADIKAYRPQSHSLSSGQVLQEPYVFDKARLVLLEMADALALDLVNIEKISDAWAYDYAEKKVAFLKEHPDLPHYFVGAGNQWGATYSYAMCYWEEQMWIRTKSITCPEFFHGMQEILVADTPVTLFMGEDEQRPLAERVARFLPKVCGNYTIIDTKELPMEGISPEFRGSLSHLMMHAVNNRVDAYMELFLRHPLSIRRYYRQFDY